jgi:hypothetical protein
VILLGRKLLLQIALGRHREFFRVSSVGHLFVLGVAPPNDAAREDDRDDKAED